MPTVKITIDDRELECDDSLNVIEAAALIGEQIPHYCWHPDMAVVGNCRMCQVEVDSGRGFAPAIGCATKVADGMKVYTKSEKALNMRKEVLEFLFLNHPLDCPICDKAGECLLQDYYQEHGRYQSRLDDEIGKIAKSAKAVRLSDLIVFDDERCVLCDRCVRFCRDVEGKEELYIGGRGSPSKVMTFPGKELTGEYQLCLTDICPVGALTSEEFRFQQRVWFLDKTPSVCGLGDSGDNILIEHRDGKVYRIMPRRHDGISGVWVKDVSRLAYKEWEADRHRLSSPTHSNGSTNGADPLVHVADALKLLPQKNTLLVVDNRLTLEEAWALKSLFNRAGCTAVAQAESRLATGRGPNGYGLDLLGFPMLDKGTITSAERVLAVGDFNEADLKAMAGRDLYLFSAHCAGIPASAKVALPLAEHMERQGTMVNSQKRLQRIHRAFEAPLPNYTGIDIACNLARLLDVELEFSDQESCFTDLAGAVLERPGMRWKELGKLGLLLEGDENPKALSELSGHKRLTWSG